MSPDATLAGGPGTEHPLLQVLGRRVRDLRRARGQTRADLALSSGLSTRFLARVESGDGNISVRRLVDLARALGTTPDALLRRDAPSSLLVALVGLRGSGKSTVGELLARRLQAEFIEIDDHIIEASGLTLDQLFELHGEHYYRRLEQETLRRILGRKEAAVISAAGGVVNDAQTWALLRQRATVVWLRARPEDHWNRVVAQGDRRPMADNPTAMQELRDLLRSREPVYAEAKHIVDTSERAPEEVANEVLRRLNDEHSSPNHGAY